MKIVALALALLLAGSSAEARMPKYWICTDAAGQKFARDYPCPEPLPPPETQPEAQQPVEAPAPSQPKPIAQQQATPQAQRRATKPVTAPSVWKSFAGLFWMALLGLFAVFVLKTLLAPMRTKMARHGSYTSSKPFERVEPSSELLGAAWSNKVTPVSIPERPTEWSIELIRKLEWKRFEELCEGYWRAKGYRAESTGRGADGGVDVNIFAPSDPNRPFAIIQCKSWATAVGVKEIRELWGVGNHFSAKLVMFYSLSGFTEEAKAFASNKHFKLFSGKDLLLQIQALSVDQQQAILAHVTRDDYVTPSCPQCEVKMIQKERKKDGYGNKKFWGCVNHPRCNQTFPLSVAR